MFSLKSLFDKYKSNNGDDIEKIGIRNKVGFYYDSIADLILNKDGTCNIYLGGGQSMDFNLCGTYEYKEDDIGGILTMKYTEEKYYGDKIKKPLIFSYKYKIEKYNFEFFNGYGKYGSDYKIIFEEDSHPFSNWNRLPNEYYINSYSMDCNVPFERIKEEINNLDYRKLNGEFKEGDKDINRYNRDIKPINLLEIFNIDKLVKPSDSILKVIAYTFSYDADDYLLVHYTINEVIFKYENGYVLIDKDNKFKTTDRFPDEALEFLTKNFI